MEDFSISQPISVFELLKSKFEDFKEYDALVHQNESVSYGKLQIMVGLVAQRIKYEAPGEKLIAISCSRSVQTIVNLLAVLASGKAYIPLDLDQPKERLERIVTETKVQYALKGHESDDFGKISLKIIEGTYSETPVEENYTSDLAYILFTSGTTGVPKGIEVCNPSLINLINWQLENSSSAPGFKTIHFAKLTFDISVQEIFTTLFSGGTLHILNNEVLKDPYQLLNYIGNKWINRLFVPFIALQGLANTAVSHKIYPDSLREIMTCGEQLKINTKVRQFFSELPSCKLFNQYGPTETTIIVSQNYLEGEPSDWEDLPSIGWPISNVDMKLVGPDGKAVTSVNQVGEIYIAGDCLARGYFKNPELTGKLFQELNLDGQKKRFYKSGDLAEWNVDGSIKFLGRVDDQVKINGFRVELGEIEVNASKIPGIEENAVVIGNFSDGQNYVALFYKANSASVTTDTIKEELRKTLPEYMIPYKCVKVDDMPRTGSSKIDRKALKNSLSVAQSRNIENAPVANDARKTLLELWKELLQQEEFEPNTNFFKVGGSSILAQKLAIGINEKIGKVFPVSMIYQYPTLERQWAYIKEGEKGKQLSSGNISKHSGSKNRDVAVIAMSGRFPGAQNTGELWEMIKNKDEGITHFSLEEIDPLVRHEAEESNYIKSRGIIEDYDKFDSEFFGMNPRLAEIMDPQQRKFLEISHEVLEKAGWISKRPDFRIGVFAGTNNNTYYSRNVVFDHDAVEIFGPNQIMSLNEKDFVASRVSYQLDLTGPAVSVYSACSTSLLAVAQAVMSIRSGQCTAAIAGGSSVTFPVRSGQRYQEGAIFSVDGHCKPFDSNSTGTMFCDGAGAVLLKDLEQAKLDGDEIYAVIKGIGISNDGIEKASFTSPSVRGEASAIKDALEDAAISADRIGYVEAHGTGTPIGDPIEVEGLKLAFGEGIPGTCAIGSVKSNIGHLTAAAGIAGFIKTVYALREQILPATYGFERPNPEIKFEGSPFYVNGETKSWKSLEKRYAGVSSFGFGGTNVHVILEEAERKSVEKNAEKAPESTDLVLISAKNEDSIALYARNLKDFVLKNPEVSISDLSGNISKRYVNYGKNVHFTASDRAGLIEQLDRLLDGSAPVLSKKGEFDFPVFLFPGQGSQYVGMGRDLYQSNQEFRNSFDACCSLFDPYLSRSLKEIIFQGSQQELAETYITQPAIFTVSYAMAKMLMSKGIVPQAFCGHSIGEYVAAHLSGIFSLEDAVKVVANRGRLIYELPKGVMLSVRCQLDILTEILPAELSLAAHNAPNLCVVSGEQSKIEVFQAVLEELGLANQMLKTSHAFHSQMMDGALEDFALVLENVQRNIPQIPIMSTQTGKWLTDAEAVSVEYWVKHIRNSVLFHDSAKSLLEERKDAYFIEVGPGNVLSSLMLQQANAKEIAIANTLNRKNEENEVLLLADQIGRLVSAGSKIDLLDFNNRQVFEFLDIPTYAFQPKTTWIQKGALLNPAFKVGAKKEVEVFLAPVEERINSSEIGGEYADESFGKIREMLESASGVRLAEADIDSSFFELGLDSLVLTQFTFSIKKEFGVAISFRQINDELNSPKALLNYLASQGSGTPVKRQETKVQQSTAGINDRPVQNHEQEKESDSVQKIQQQLEAIQKQLALLTGGKNLSSDEDEIVQGNKRPEKPLAEKYLGKLTLRQPASQKSEKLSEDALKYLTEFKDKYTLKTSKSKEYYDSHNLNRFALLPGQLSKGDLLQDCDGLAYPIVSKYSDGSKLVDLDGNDYLDWHFSFGSRLFGYNADFIKKALKTQISEGLEFGTHLVQEREVIRLFKNLTNSKEAYLYSSFSEALIRAIEECKSKSSKANVVVISDSEKLSSEANKMPCGSLGNPNCLEFLVDEFAEDIILLDVKHDDCLGFVKERSSEIAAVLLDINVGSLSAEDLRNFLALLRQETREAGVFLILNEIQTGFNTYLSGVSEMMAAKPDLVVFGNLIGEGLQLGILGVNRNRVSFPAQDPASKMYELGEYKGDSFVLAATAALLKELEQRGGQFLEDLSKKTTELVHRLNELFAKYRCPFYAESFRSIWRIREIETSAKSGLFYVLMRYEGIHMLRDTPCFMTLTHSRIDLEQTLVIVEKVLGAMIEHDLIKGDLPDLEELVMDTSNPPFPGAKIGLDKEGNPIWVYSK